MAAARDASGLRLPYFKKKDSDKHLKAAIDCAYHQGTMTFLPKETIRAVLGANPTGAKVFAEQLKSRTAVWALSDDAPFDKHAPYAKIIEHLDLLGELPGGIGRAIELCSVVGTRYFEQYWFFDGCSHVSNWIEEGCARFDRALLRQFMLSNPVDWDVEIIDHLFVTDEREAAYLGLRPGMSRTARQAEGKLLVERLALWYFPMSRRYIREISSKESASAILPKIAGHILPPELLELVREHLYDQDFLDSAPELAKAEHDVWTFGEDSDDDDH